MPDTIVFVFVIVGVTPSFVGGEGQVPKDGVHGQSVWRCVYVSGFDE